MIATHRLRQGLRALFAFTQSVDLDLAAQYLSSAQMSLFQRMNRSERLHSLNVLRDVLKSGQTPHDLAVAALLHDVGKIRYPLAIWQKTLAVLVRAFSPEVFQEWSQKNPDNLLYRAFVVSEQHPIWSSALVRETGASERTIWLIEHHADEAAVWQDHPHHTLLVRLKAADDNN